MGKRVSKTLQGRVVSLGNAEGKIIFYRPQKKKKMFRNKIVVIDDINPAEVINRIKKAKGIIAQKGE